MGYFPKILRLNEGRPPEYNLKDNLNARQY